MSRLDILEEMRGYYRARAPEYDDWYFRRNSYDKGHKLNRRWFRDLKVLRRYARLIRGHNILEIAAGTGMWTQYLRENNAVTPMDTAPEALAINYQRTGLKGVIGDAFDLSYHKQYKHDCCFFAFWLSHIPPPRLTPFFADLGATIKPRGRAIIFDSVYNPAELNCLSHRDEIQVRALRSGTTYRVYKKYYTPFELHSLAGRFFTDYALLFTDHYFFILDGLMRPVSPSEFAAQDIHT